MPIVVRKSGADWPAKIKALRELKKVSQSGLARLLGVLPSMVSRWEAGVKEPSLKNYEALASIANRGELAGWFRDRAIAGTPGAAELVDSLVKGAAVLRIDRIVAARDPGDTVSVPLLRDSAAAGSPRMIEERDVEAVLQVPKQFCAVTRGVVCVRVVGDSMTPILEPGYIIAIDTTQRDPHRLKNQMCIIRDPDGGVTVKWLRKIDENWAAIPQHTSLRHPIVLLKEGYAVVGPVLWWIGQPPKP